MDNYQRDFSSLDKVGPRKLGISIGVGKLGNRQEWSEVAGEQVERRRAGKC